MSMSIDTPLDTAIQKHKRGGNRRRSGKSGSARPLPRPPAGNGRAATASAPAKISGTKIQLSNLPYDVTEDQIRELFKSTVGAVRHVSLAYDATGRSKGVATITFSKPESSQKAYELYNKRLIDGAVNKPLKVEILVDLNSVAVAPPQSLSERLGLTKNGAEAAAAAAAPAGNLSKSQKKRLKRKTKTNNGAAKADGAMEVDSGSSSAQAAGGRARRTRKNPRNRRGGGAKRPTPTAESLDAEMSDYISSAPAPASGAAPAETTST